MSVLRLADDPQSAERWRPTAALVRSVVLGAAGLAAGTALGRPELLVVAVPLLTCGLAALLRRPAAPATVAATLDHGWLHEGQATVARLRVRCGGTGGGSDDAIEQVTRAAAPGEHERVEPAPGCVVTRWWPAAPPDLVVSPRRWGLRDLGQERVALTSGWGGYRWGPVALPGRQVRVLPATTYRSRAEQPHPRGLVGAHRSTRDGAGSEPSGIRAFAPGDRLRRVNWRVSARTGVLHVTTTRAEQDAGVLIVVDLHGEHGTSGGVDGPASSLDATVRAAAALAEHAVQVGDRVALRAVGGRMRPVPSGTGRRHLRRLLGVLADVRTGSSPYEGSRLADLPAGAGATVLVLSPLLVDATATAAATLVRRGLPTVVVDTLPEDAAPDPGDADPRLVDLAWRMRRLERTAVSAALDAIGCPVVAWRGAGTVDDVLLRLARRPPVARS